MALSGTAVLLTCRSFGFAYWMRHLGGLANFLDLFCWALFWRAWRHQVRLGMWYLSAWWRQVGTGTAIWSPRQGQVGPATARWAALRGQDGLKTAFWKAWWCQVHVESKKKTSSFCRPGLWFFLLAKLLTCRANFFVQFLDNFWKIAFFSDFFWWLRASTRAIEAWILLKQSKTSATATHCRVWEALDSNELIQNLWQCYQTAVLTRCYCDGYWREHSCNDSCFLFQPLGPSVKSFGRFYFVSFKGI